MKTTRVPPEDPMCHRVALPLVRCAHAARPGEEMTPDRVAAVLLAEEAEAALGERLRGLDVELLGE